MHIFLDSNVLFEDYFFDNKFNSQLLVFSRDNELDLYMSDVVKSELRGQYKVQLELLNKSLRTTRKLCRKKRVQIEIPPAFDVDEQLAAFDSFYRENEQEGIIKIIASRDDLMQEIIYRWTHDIKPFVKGKSEFKDTIIWLNYAREAEEIEA